jgi:hypothetical protein
MSPPMPLSSRIVTVLALSVCHQSPASRGCHRTKQAPGWRLEQPTPGNFVWHLPSGRTITSEPDPYPM